MFALKYGILEVYPKTVEEFLIMETQCIFCKIINQEIPSAKVYEDDVVYAFLDITQVTPGHTLIIPKKHVVDIFDYTPELAGEVMSRLPHIAHALKQSFPEMKGLNIINNNGEAAYQTVFHSHWHLIPRYSSEDGFSMQFENNQDSYTQEEFSDRAKFIGKNI